MSRQEPTSHDRVKAAARRTLSRWDAAELREWTACMLSDGTPHPDLGFAIDRLASMAGDLPTVLRDLADDVDAIRGGHGMPWAT